MFIVAIPTRFELDLRRGRPAEVQVTVDATAMQRASIGAGSCPWAVPEPAKGGWHGFFRANWYHAGPQARRLPTVSRSSCP